jgi:hypothetical protein
MKLPRGAHEIAQARANGMRPELPVIVSMVGALPHEANPTVHADGPNYDWRFLAELDVFVFVSPQSQSVQALLKAIAHQTERIFLWDVVARRGMDLWPIWKGVNVPEVHGTSNLADRRRAILARWGQFRWWPAENERFACA